MPSPLSRMLAFLGLPSGSWGEAEVKARLCQSLTWEVGKACTHQNLHSEQALPSVPGIDGELHRQAGRDAGGVEARAAGPHLAGIMGWEHLDLEGA